MFKKMKTIFKGRTSQLGVKSQWYLKGKIVEMEEAIDSYTESILEMKAQKNVANRKINGLQSESKLVKERLEEIKSNNKGKYSPAMNILIDRFKTIQKEIENLGGQHRDADKMINNLQSAKDTLVSKLADTKSKIRIIDAKRNFSKTMSKVTTSKNGINMTELDSIKDETDLEYEKNVIRASEIQKEDGFDDVKDYENELKNIIG